jgi:IS30 family transposase
MEAFRQKGCLRKDLIYIERQTKYPTCQPVCQSILQGLTPYQSQIHTITYDNRLKFSEHQNMAQTLSVNIYFGHPYSSWEKEFKRKYEWAHSTIFTKITTLE